MSNLILNKDWIYAFTKSPSVVDIFQKVFDEDFGKYNEFFLKMLETNLENSKKFLRITEKSKEVLRKRYENEIYDQNLMILEEQDLKKQNEIFLSEKKSRCYKYTWDKSWKKMRTHYGFWMHPELITQNDKKYDPIDFEYENIQPNKFFYYKIWKYELKNRSRPLLKLKLKEPELVLRNKEELKIKNHAILNNYQSILHLAPLKSQNISPQVPNTTTEDTNSNSTRKKFISDMRKNITNSIKAIQTKALPFLHFNKNGKVINYIINFVLDDIYLQKRCQWIKSLSIRYGVLTVTSEKLM